MGARRARHHRARCRAGGTRAAVVQNLTVGLNIIDVAVPLSEWLTAAIALLLGATAFFALRRKGVRGGRLFGWMLALLAGATLVAVAGKQGISDAQALRAFPAIKLAVSAGTLDVATYYSTSPLTVIVTNTTTRSVRINAIALDPGLYRLSTPTTCSVGGNLPPSGTCTITLDAAE